MKKNNIVGTEKSKSYAFYIGDPCYIDSTKNFYKKISKSFKKCNPTINTGRMSSSIVFRGTRKQKGIITEFLASNGMQKSAEIRFHPESKNDTWINVGEATVDSGQIVFGDPFDPFLPEFGTKIDNFGGDGVYTVSLQLSSKAGIVKAAKIEFYYWEIFPENKAFLYNP